MIYNLKYFPITHSDSYFGIHRRIFILIPVIDNQEYGWLRIGLYDVTKREFDISIPNFLVENLELFD